MPALDILCTSKFQQMRHVLLLVIAIVWVGCASPGKDDVPAGSLVGDSASGSTIYSTTCAQCHGGQGKGDGPGAEHINPKPSDLRVRVRQYDDRGLFLLIRKGGMFVGKPAMPPSPQLTDDEIKDLIAHLRSLSADSR